ncbi:hypothetical protein J4455_03915 [Candidatus Woesearchaeota archaeon]|nr:hypothetical protein [Candidatus Woesearchaeota archaeon]
MVKKDLKPVFDAFKAKERESYKTENILYGLDIAKGTAPYALAGVAAKYALYGIGEGYDRLSALVDKTKESVRIDKKIGDWFDKVTGKEQQTQDVVGEPKVDYSEKLNGYGNLALLVALGVGLGVSALRGSGQHYDRKIRKRQIVATEEQTRALRNLERIMQQNNDLTSE